MQKIENINHSTTINNVDDGVLPATKAFHRISLAMFFAGFVTFSLLYCVQPLLPSFASHFHVTPSESSLALSLSTGFLAFSILLSSAFSEALGRRGLMACSMLGAALCNLAAAFAPSWHWLLVARALEGIMLGGVPAVAMAYLAEEISPKGLGKIMGLYVGGTAFGGMMGRVGMGILIEWFDWHGALAIIGVVDLIAAIIFYLLLPKPHHFIRHKGFDVRHHIHAWFGHIDSMRLLLIFCYIFLIFGVFVAILNYANFRLSAPPFNLSPTQIGCVFLSFIAGMIVSPIAGSLTEKYPRSNLLIAAVLILFLGLICTLSTSLIWFITGITLITIGFFTAHSVASAWVGRIAVGAKGHASALYLLFYYMGSSFIGAFGGWFWFKGGWTTVIIFTSCLLLLALIICFYLKKIAKVNEKNTKNFMT